MKNYLFHTNLHFLYRQWFIIILLFIIPIFASAQSCELNLQVVDIHCSGATGSITVALTTDETGTFTLDWSGTSGASTIPSTTYVVTAGDIDPTTGLFEGEVLMISGLNGGFYFLEVTAPGGNDCAAQAIVNQTDLLDSPSCSGGTIYLATSPGLCTGMIENTSWEWNPNCGYYVATIGYNPYTIDNVGIVVYDYREDFVNGSVQCTYQVYLYDLEPPTISCSSDVSATITDGTCSVPVFWNVGASDNCDVYNISSTCFYPDGSQGPCASGNEYPFGTTTVVSTATDYYNNKSDCTFSITVNDASPGTLFFTGNISDGVYHANHIISNGNVLSNRNVNFKAEQQIQLDQGFTVQPGGNFAGEIDDCSGN